MANFKYIKSFLSFKKNYRKRTWRENSNNEQKE